MIVKIQQTNIDGNKRYSPYDSKKISKIKKEKQKAYRNNAYDIVNM
jgi:hypothetical protein